MYLIVGLGNPGEKFLNTRHNLGFQVVDELARKLGDRLQVTGDRWEKNAKFKAEIIKIDYNLQPETCNLILAKPLTFMNLSGMAVEPISKYYKIPIENIIVIHDELDLPLGHIKIRTGGSGAGHHGVESVMEMLGNEKFIRVRLGISTWHAISGEHKHAAFNAEKFVFDQFIPGEKSKVKAMIKRAVKAVEAILELGVEKAQNQYNDKGA
jgi:peptidyl-tRNA hydrolase, PTH1 family